MKADTVSNPDAAEAVDFIEEGILRDMVITIFGECEVDYDGAAKSFLPLGDRIIMMKPDGTLMVHTDEKRKPVNWQTPGATRDIGIEDGDLHIESRQSGTTVEELNIWFTEVYQISTMKVVDGQEKDLTGTEEDLRQRLVDNPDLIDDGFRVQDTEWPTAAGPVDIHGFDSDGVLTLVELKRRQIDPDAVEQLERYVEAVQQDADNEIRGILIGPSISDRGENFAEEKGFEYREVDPRRRLSSDSATLADF